jgi:hypothetical protein
MAAPVPPKAPALRPRSSPFDRKRAGERPGQWQRHEPSLQPSGHRDRKAGDHERQHRHPGDDPIVAGAHLPRDPLPRRPEEERGGKDRQGRAAPLQPHRPMKEHWHRHQRHAAALDGQPKAIEPLGGRLGLDRQGDWQEDDEEAVERRRWWQRGEGAEHEQPCDHPPDEGNDHRHRREGRLTP